MRHTCWLLIVLAGTGGAQWRRFGEGRPAPRTVFSGARHARRPQRRAGARGNGSSGVVQSVGRTFAGLGRHSLGAQAIHPPPELDLRREPCSRSPARPHRPRRWSTRGPRNPGTTTTLRTDVAACAGTTRKSSGAARKKWDARWRGQEDERSGFATTIRQATGWASGRISPVYTNPLSQPAAQQ